MRNGGYKVREAAFFLGKMRQALTRAQDRPELQDAIENAKSLPGAVVVTQWQPHLYYYFDAFLAATRSVPDIIQAWLGVIRGPGSNVFPPRNKHAESSSKIDFDLSIQNSTSTW
jgi:hypothetical protein